MEDRGAPVLDHLRHKAWPWLVGRAREVRDWALGGGESGESGGEGGRESGDSSRAG